MNLFNTILYNFVVTSSVVQDTNVTSSLSTTNATAGDGDRDDDDDGGVEAKRPRLEDDDDDDDTDKADTSLSWPHCFTTDRLADNEAVLPFER